MIDGAIVSTQADQGGLDSAFLPSNSFLSFQSNTGFTSPHVTKAIVSSLRMRIMKSNSEKNTERSFSIFTSLHATSFNKQVVSWLYPSQKLSLLQQSIADAQTMQFKEVVEGMISNTCQGIIVEFDSKFAVTTNLLRLEGYNTLALEKDMSNVRAAHAAGMQNIVHGDHTDLDRVLNGVVHKQICAAVKFVHNFDVTDFSGFLAQLSKFQKTGDKLVIPIVESNEQMSLLDEKLIEEEHRNLKVTLSKLVADAGYRLQESCFESGTASESNLFSCALMKFKTWFKLSTKPKGDAEYDLKFSDSSLLIVEKL